MAFLCGEYKTIIYRGKGLSDCLLREVNKLSYTLNLSVYCASIEGAICSDVMDASAPKLAVLCQA